MKFRKRKSDEPRRPNVIFGNCWDLLGRLEESEVVAQVGSINDDTSFSIGLTAMQLTNIGNYYGQVSVKIATDGEETQVGVYNAGGGSASKQKDSIVVSRALAEKVELSVGDKIILRRILDEPEKLKYFCENQNDNPFGRGWDKLSCPVQGIVAAVDNDGYNCELYGVGLTAMQMRNLGIEGESAPLKPKDILEIKRRMEKGLLDGRKFGELELEYNGKSLPAQVYNSFVMRAIRGCGVRVSSILAEDLGLKLEDKVRLYKR